MKLASYPEYKDSGVPWLGKIPVNWDVKPGLAFLSERKEKNIGMKESTVLSLSYGRIVVKPPEKLHGLVPESFETYQIAEPGNIIIRGTDLQNDKTSLRVGKVRNRGIITSAYLCLQPNEKINSDYTHLLLHGYDLKKVYYGMGSGLRQNLDFSDFKRLPVLVPTDTEQSRIHIYVESISAQINKFIHNKRRFIELLREKKQNAINQAVTRGLNPNVKFKPSGVGWIKDIPEHWEFNRGKYYFREVDARSVTGEEELLSVSHLTGVTPRSQKNINMFKAESYVGSKVCRPGYIAVNTMWAWMAAVGVSTYTGVISPSYHTYEQIDRENYVDGFLDLLLRSSPYKHLYTVNSKGITSSRLRLYPEEFLDLQFSPPRPEQELILLWIDENTGMINSAISRAESEIELIREYRTRLISDAVTGQVDVRGIEVPEVAGEELLALDEDISETDGVIDDEGGMDEAV